MSTMAAAVDPYSAIRNLKFTPSYIVQANLGGGNRINETFTDKAAADARAAELGGAGKVSTSYLPDDGALRAGGYQTKYGSNAVDQGDGTFLVNLQQPGAHKFDTMDAVFKLDPATGQAVLVNDPMQAKTRQTSSARDTVTGIGTGAAFIAGGAALANAAGMGAAGTGATAGTGAAASGLDAYYLTGAVEGSTIGGAAAGGGGAGAVGAGSMASAIAAPIEAGKIGGGSLMSSGGAPAATGAASGAAPAAGGGTVGSSTYTASQVAGAADKLTAGATAMGASDWINLGQLALGAYGVSQAGNAASNATDAASRVAQGQLDLNREALDWYKQTYNEQAPNRAAAEKRAQEVSDAQLDGMKFATGQARELDAYNKATFRPLEQRMVTEAGAYDTPERRMAAAASAGADVDMSTNAAREAAERNLARSGVAPGSAKSLAFAEDSAVAQGRNRGTAMTGAARTVEQQGYARMADAVNLGRGIATTQATQQNIATTTGNSSVGNSGAALTAATSGNGLMQDGYRTVTSGNSVAGNLFNSVASGQRADDRQMLDGISGIGSFLGRTYGTSDKNKKKGTGTPADGEQALAEIEATEVESGWTYKDDPTQTPRTGAMAQTVRKISGEAAAPGGKVIDLVSQQGRMMAAIKTLAKKVEQLEAA